MARLPFLHPISQKPKTMKNTRGVPRGRGQTAPESETAYIMDAIPLPPSQPITNVIAYLITVRTKVQISFFFILIIC